MKATVLDPQNGRVKEEPVKKDSAGRFSLEVMISFGRAVVVWVER